MEAQEVAVIIGAVAALVVTIAGVFMKWLNTITKEDRKERICTAEVNARVLDTLAKAMAENTASNREIARETKKAASEAKERNGHLAELQIKSQEMIDRNLTEYKKMNLQEERHIATNLKAIEEK